MVPEDKIKISPLAVDLFLWLGFFLVGGFSIFYSLRVPNVLLEQGLSHRIFYFHVPVAWVALYGPILSFFASILFLWKRDPDWDRISFSLNQVSLVFALGVLISGPIWAKSAWGVPWDWTDARLQSFFVLCLSLSGYFIFRSLVTNPNKRALVSSFLTILCAVNAILVWGAIRWFDNPGNHPSSVLGKGGMDPDMKFSFYMAVLGYHFLFLVLIRISYRQQKIESGKEILLEKLDS
jgi:heme exporter protein C